MKRPRARSKQPNPGGMAFGRNLLVLAGLLLAIGTYAAVRGALTRSWPKTDATITSAALIRQHTSTNRRDGAGAEESWNSFHVLYRYRVGDTDYVSGRVEPYDLGMQNSAGAAKMRERHPEGSTARIAYDPEDPSIAYLEPGPSSFSLVLTAIGSVIFGVGFWVRRKAAQGIGRMNEEGATERLNRAVNRGDSL